MPRADVHVQRIGGEAVVFTDDGERILVLNAPATFIFDALDEGIEEAELAERFCERFDAPLAEAPEAIRQTIDELQTANVL